MKNWLRFAALSLIAMTLGTRAEAEEWLTFYQKDDFLGTTKYFSSLKSSSPPGEFSLFFRCDNNEFDAYIVGHGKAFTTENIPADMRFGEEQPISVLWSRGQSSETLFFSRRPQGIRYDKAWLEEVTREKGALDKMLVSNVAEMRPALWLAWQVGRHGQFRIRINDVPQHQVEFNADKAREAVNFVLGQCGETLIPDLAKRDAAERTEKARQEEVARWERIKRPFATEWFTQRVTRERSWSVRDIPEDGCFEVKVPELEDGTRVAIYLFSNQITYERIEISRSNEVKIIEGPRQRVDIVQEQARSPVTAHGRFWPKTSFGCEEIPAPL